MVEFIDKTSEKKGTAFNRKNMMAVQGFIGMTTEKLEDGSILQINDDNQTLRTHKKEDGSIVQTFTGEKVIVKTIKKQDGKIIETLEAVE